MWQLATVIDPHLAGDAMPSMSTKSFGIALVLMLAGFFASGTARADATFEFALSGQLDFSCQYPSACGPGLPTDYFLPWTGQLTVVLDSDADGMYDNADMVSFDLASTCCTFREPSFTFVPFYANFIVADGKLTSIGAVYYDASEPEVTTTFSGLTVSFYQPLISFTPPTVGTAVLTPVPEPGSRAMLLFGLALAGVGARINRERPGAA
jgi:PEP-CTERM motif